MKKLWSVFVVLVLSMLAVTSVHALTADEVLDIDTIKINGIEVLQSGDREIDPNADLISVDEGEKLDIEIIVRAGDLGAEDIEIDAKIAGIEDYNLYDSEYEQELLPNERRRFRLSLDVPRRTEKTNYDLRLRVLEKSGVSFEDEVELSMRPLTHAVDIVDVAFSPSTTIKAGRSLLVSVLTENYGNNHEKDVKVTASIPALGIQATEYVDKIKHDGENNVDREDVPELFLPIPADAKAGEYTVEVVAKYDFLDEEVKKAYKITVTADERFQTSDKVVLAVGPEQQSVVAGQAASYGVALTNAGRTTKAFTVDVATGGWGTAKVSDALVVLEPGQNKVVYVDITANENAAAGSNVASLTVREGSEVVKTVVLKADVVAAQEDTTSLRNGLEIALVVLVVVLVILGLIIGFSRLRRDDEEEEQTYY